MNEWMHERWNEMITWGALCWKTSTTGVTAGEGEEEGEEDKIQPSSSLSLCPPSVLLFFLLRRFFALLTLLELAILGLKGWEVWFNTSPYGLNANLLPPPPASCTIFGISLQQQHSCCGPTLLFYSLKSVRPKKYFFPHKKVVLCSAALFSSYFLNG